MHLPLSLSLCCIPRRQDTTPAYTPAPPVNAGGVFSCGGYYPCRAVSKEQIEWGREPDLLSCLQTYEPYELVRTGPNRHTTATHDSLIISNGKWRWNSQGIGGVSALGFSTK